VKTRKGYTPAGRLYSTFWSNLSKNFSFGAYILVVAPMEVKFGMEKATFSVPNFTPIGATCRPCDGGEIWHGAGDLLHAKFHPIGATCRSCGAKNLKIGP